MSFHYRSIPFGPSPSSLLSCHPIVDNDENNENGAVRQRNVSRGDVATLELPGAASVRPTMAWMAIAIGVWPRAAGITAFDDFNDDGAP